MYENLAKFVPSTRLGLRGASPATGTWQKVITDHPRFEVARREQEADEVIFAGLMVDPLLDELPLGSRVNLTIGLGTELLGDFLGGLAAQA